MISAVVFDVGETLVDETRGFEAWADWLGVPRLTFATVVGAVIAGGRDFRETLSALRELGVRVGIVGNQTSRGGGILRSLDLPADFIATSEDWGVAKPAAEFFAKVAEAASTSADEIVYVGDRIDNDIVPAKKAGMRTAFVQRGPWGWIFRDELEVTDLSDWRIRDLTELPDIVSAENY